MTNCKLSYLVENLYTIRDEIQTLVLDHWEEVESYKDKIPLDVNWSQYEALNDAGMLGVYTVRKENKLVGYFLVVASPNLHHSQDIFALSDILYLDPEFRKGFTAVRLLRFAEKDLKSKGVSVLQINSKTSYPLDSLLTRLNFKEKETVFSKYIGE